MKRRATHLAKKMLERLVAAHEDWPLTIITELYVCGSYARGAVEPHDLDVQVEIDRHDERWISHLITCLSTAAIRTASSAETLVVGSRNHQFLSRPATGSTFR